MSFRDLEIGGFMPARICSVLIVFALLVQPAAAVPTQGHQIMYAGPSTHAVDIAREIHIQGGNAVDIAVAVGLSLAVTHPYYASFGGGGFAVIKMNGKTRAFDFREMAPGAANPDTFKDKDSRNGGAAVGVPGVPRGLWDLHKAHGKLKWSKLFDGALRLSEKGFRVSGEWVSLTSRNKDRFTSGGREFFFRKGIGKDLQSLKPGERLRQPGLAKFLRAFQKDGPSAFYEGEVARDLVSAVNASGGFFKPEDLKNYKTRWLEPITVDFNGYQLSLMPPPSSGGIVIAQALRLMERLKLQQAKPLSVDELHFLGEILKLSFRGRQLLGDPDFAKSPIKELLDDKYIGEMAALIKLDNVIDPEPLKELRFESENTTHFSVLSANGDAVSLTVTLNGEYGSGVVTPKFGIALNNEMDDFTTKLGEPNMFGLIQGVANQVRAGARPLSSMSPTIVEKNGATIMAVGAPGGPRIISGVLQVLYRSLAQTFDIDQAIQAPRVHHQFLPNVLKLDPQRFSPETIAALEKRGHKVEQSPVARVFGVRRDDAGILYGAFDARGEGAAGGL